jgi:hypothetical protein
MMPWPCTLHGCRRWGCRTQGEQTAASMSVVCSIYIFFTPTSRPAQCYVASAGDGAAGPTVSSLQPGVHASFCNCYCHFHAMCIVMLQVQEMGLQGPR